MADAAVTFLLENLGEVLAGYANLITGALREVKEVQDEIEILNTFLRDPAIQQEERFAELARQVREVVYGAEDITDSLVIKELEAAATVFRPTRAANRLTLAEDLTSFRKGKLTRMLHRVKVARDEIKLIADGSGVRVQPNVLNQVPSINPETIVGFEDEAKTFVSNLMEETEELHVISITGMPGTGKTTLAWKIYNDPIIEYKFPTRIWITIPQQFHKRDFYLSILKKLTVNQEEYDCLIMPTHYIADKIARVLERTRFFLVMEDIFTHEAWDAIRAILPKRNTVGKVLITSSNKSVCWYASTNRKPHTLRFRNEKESWQLLQLQVFGKLGECPQWLEPMGKRVAERCGGLPLAIEVIASNLVVAESTKTAIDLTMQWWEKVSKNVTMYVTDYKQRAFSSLELSYYKLPDRLRDCFLYFGMFPEDYEIPIRTLTCLWIAEGFVQDVGGLSLEERAVEILYDLVQRNLVMVDKLYPTGELKTCRVHKVTHGFCQSKAAEQNLFQEIKLSEEGALDTPVSLTQNYRRLCIHSGLPQYLSGQKNPTGVRSILCFTKENTILNPSDGSTIRKAFKFLKVLESRSIKFAEFPKMLAKLMNLKYISLCCDHLHALPETVSQLPNLQTLVVETKSPSLEIRGDIWRMVGLRHLITTATIILATKSVEGKHGENLQTLSRLSPEYCTEDVFRRACNLKKLGIRGKLATQLLATELLRNLECLESLKLVNETPGAPTRNDQFIRRLHPNCFPSTLKSLTLSATFFDWQDMLTLGNIVTLKILKLKDNAFSGGSWTTDANGFQRLEFLFIKGTDLVTWEATADCFPRLLRLVLKNCEKLEKIPLSQAKNLAVLELDKVSESAVKYARKIEEEKNQMQRQRNSKLGEFKLIIHAGSEGSSNNQAQTVTPQIFS